VQQPPGFADFLRGTMALFQYSRALRFALHIDLTRHPIGTYLVGAPAELTDDTVHEFFNENQPNLEPFLRRLAPAARHYLTTHNFPAEALDRACKDFMKAVLTPTAEYESQLGSIMKQLDLHPNYCVIHVRAGDRSATFGNQQFEATDSVSCVAAISNRLSDYITTTVAPAWAPEILIISDNRLIAERLSEQHALKALNGTPVHLGWAAVAADVRHTLTEFFLMTRCSSIYQWSVYGGSGFSEIVSQIYDIPLHKIG
jgi:hypothetical protein